MPFACASLNYLAIGYDRTVLVYNQDGQVVQTLDTSQVLAKPENGNSGKKKTKNRESPDLVHGCFSNKYLAVCDSDKNLILWSTLDWSFLSTTLVERKPVKMFFDHAETSVLLADRAGDVYGLLIDSDNKKIENKPLLGHISILLDIALCPRSKLLLTADRDEKIRVSNYPNCYNIDGYCLGHEEFVSTIAILSDDLLLSGGGDGTLRLWNYRNQQQLHVHRCVEDLIEKADQVVIRSLIHLSGNRIAVVINSIMKLFIYTFQASSITFETAVELDSEPLLLMKLSDNLLVLLTKDEKQPLRALNISELSLLDPSSSSLLHAVNSNEQFVKAMNALNAADDFDWLPKWRGQEGQTPSRYEKRKQERLEEQAQKRAKLLNT